MEFHQKVSENQIYQDLTWCLANSLNEVFKNLPIEIKKMIPNVIEPKDFWKVITTEVKAFQDFVFQVQEMGQSLIDEVSKIENSSDILRQMQKKAEGISVSPKELVQGVCLVGADLIQQAIISLAVPGGVLKLSSVILSASQKLKSLIQLQKWIGKFEKLKSTKIIEEITLCRLQK